MNRHLFVTDLDGTLLTPDSIVDPESAEIISQLTREGALVTVATARTPATVEPLLARTFTAIPAIVMTGAAEWDRLEQSFAGAYIIPPGTELTLVQRFLDHGINPFIYTLSRVGTLDVYHNGRLTRQEYRFYMDRRGLKLKRFYLDRQESYTSPLADTMLLLGIGSTPDVMALADSLRDDATMQVSVSAYADIFNPDFAYIEVFDAGVSKADAVLRLADELGATRITVYGDNLNDLPMFAVADDSVAVANALPEVRAAAGRTIGPNTEPSVARDMLRLWHEEE